MKKLILFSVLYILPNLLFCQDSYTTVKTNTTEVKIPGKWQELNKMNDSGQTYLKNDEGVIIAVAQNPKNAYPFFKRNKSDFENVKLFYTWDSDYMIQNKYKTEKIKENRKSEYIIWRYNDGKLDNFFLFGSRKDNFLNLLVYSKIWTDDQKVSFLENLYQVNK